MYVKVMYGLTHGCALLRIPRRETVGMSRQIFYCILYMYVRMHIIFCLQILFQQPQSETTWQTIADRQDPAHYFTITNMQTMIHCC